MTTASNPIDPLVVGLRHLGHALIFRVRVMPIQQMTRPARGEQDQPFVRIAAPVLAYSNERGPRTVIWRDISWPLLLLCSCRPFHGQSTFPELDAICEYWKGGSLGKCEEEVIYLP